MSDVESWSRDSTRGPGDGRYAPGTDATEVAFRTTDEPLDVAATVAAVLRGEENG
jgi:hypothetical protein